MDGPLDSSRPGGSEFVASEVLGSGAVAAWWRSPWIPGGLTLDIDGAEQSTIFPEDQSRLLYDYLQWMHAALQLWTLPRIEPGSATFIHLGGGGLSLPRALAVSDPAGTHIVVDLDPDLIDVVLARVPFLSEKAPVVIAGDVRDALPQAVEAAGGLADALVLDIAIEPDSPDRLFDPEFMTEMFDAVRPGGLVLINIGDDPGLDATRRMAGSLEQAGGSYFVAADSSMFTLAIPGNVVLGARRGSGVRKDAGARRDAESQRDSGVFDADELVQLHAAGPRPGTVMSPAEFTELFARHDRAGAPNNRRWENK